MAIIYTYPLKPVPSLEDSIVITDSADKKKTKITSVQAVIDLLPFVFAENAWSRIDTYTGGGLTGSAIAVGVNQLLNLTSGSLTFTNPDSSTINIEAPPGDGNIADRNLTFDNNWQADLNNFTWDLHNAGLGVMHFETNKIGIGSGTSVWDIPINENNQGEKNIYLGGDPALTSNHQFASYMISIGEDALKYAGFYDYPVTGWDNNNNECVAIGYQSQELLGQVPWAPLGIAPLTQYGQNVSVGHRSLASNTGNTSAVSGLPTLGSFNVAIGGRSLEAANGATANMAIGHNSLLALIDSAFNTVAGFETGLQHNDGGTGYPTTIDLSTGASNVMVGKYTNTDNGSNNTIIGDNTSTGTSGIGSVPNSNINIGANSYLPTTLSINIGNDNWYDPSGASTVAPIYPAGGGFFDVGDGQIITIGHQSMFFGNAATAGAGVTYSTHIGTGQFLYGQAIDALGNGIMVGVDPTNPLGNPAYSADSENIVIIGNYSYAAGADNTLVGVESAVGGATFGGTAWEKNVVVGYQASSNGSWNTVLGEGAVATSSFGSDVLIGSAANINVTNAGYNTIVGCDSIDVGLQANTLVGYGNTAGASAANTVGVGYDVDTNSIGSVVVGSNSNDGALNGTVTLGANASPLGDYTLTVADGISTYISLSSDNNVAGALSVMNLAGDLSISGNKPYVIFTDPPNIITFDEQQAKFEGQTITKENFHLYTGAAIQIDFNTGDTQVIDLNDQAGALTLQWPQNIEPGTYVIRFEQGAGVATPAGIVYPIPGGPGQVWYWPAGVAAQLTPNPGAQDILTIHSDGTGLYGVMTNNFL